MAQKSCFANDNDDDEMISLNNILCLSCSALPSMWPYKRLKWPGSVYEIYSLLTSFE
jgi:hypothetical protein